MLTVSLEPALISGFTLDLGLTRFASTINIVDRRFTVWATSGQSRSKLSGDFGFLRSGFSGTFGCPV